MKKLLFEIGTEEIPANFMTGSLAQLKTLAEKKLAERRIPFGSVKVLGTPRRLTFIASDVAETQADSVEEYKGPSAQIAFKDGAPTKAAQGFARGKGVAVEDLEVRDGYIYAVKKITGADVAGLLPELLLDVLKSLSFNRTMRWADHEFRFVRPFHWLVALFGSEVIPLELNGVQSGNVSRGHRFLCHEPVVITDADAYEDAMEKAFVMVDQDKRMETIRQQVIELAHQEGGEAQIPADLLEEVTYLVEWPTAIAGTFEDKFLRLPKECIVTPMRDHQRYFPVLAADGKLLAKFITIRNGGADTQGIVAHGNERVLRARLSDAEFFFDEDRKKPLEGYLEKLKTVVFQEGLGNMNDKTERLMHAVEMLHAGARRCCEKLPVELADLKRAAQLCKCDLVTGMVVEFTELQGVMGRNYALLDGEKPEVAQAIDEHYMPRFAGDVLPQSDMGRLLSLADKADNIVATFSRGQAPTGSQDPFALRRQALGIVNMLIDGEINIPLMGVMASALYLLNVPKEKIKELTVQTTEFVLGRFRNLMLERGIRYDVIDAVMPETLEMDVEVDVFDLFQRAQALNAYVATPEAETLIQASTRVSNLCKKIEKPVEVNQDLFTLDAEKALCAEAEQLATEVAGAIMLQKYGAALIAAAKLAPAINKFFDDVMVMDKDEAVKNNRLALLAQVRKLTCAVGDLGKIVQ